MSIHRSLRSSGSLEKHRNVLSRLERIEKLEKMEKWDEEENSIFGLPKVRNIKAKKKKKKAEEEEDVAAVEAEGVAEGVEVAGAAEESATESEE